MTGYVHDMIDKNLDFNAFVWTCARAFGASDTLEKPVDSYYKDQGKIAVDTLARLKKMTPKAQLQYGEKQKKALITITKKSLAESVKINSKIDKMTEKVKNWEPASDYFNLKKFITRIFHRYHLL